MSSLYGIWSQNVHYVMKCPSTSCDHGTSWKFHVTTWLNPWICHYPNCPVSDCPKFTPMLVCPELLQFRLLRIAPIPFAPILIYHESECHEYPWFYCTELPWFRFPRIAQISIAPIYFTQTCKYRWYAFEFYGPILQICKRWPKTQNKSNVYLYIF